MGQDPNEIEKGINPSVSGGSQNHTLNPLLAPVISLCFLTFYAAAMKRTWIKWDFEQETYFRLALLVALISAGWIAASHVWRAPSVKRST